jgi:hypothetical protein
MAVRLSASRAGHPLAPRRFLVFISVRDRVDPRAIVRLEGLVHLKNPMTSSGIEPATFRLVAQCVNQLCYRVLRIMQIQEHSASTLCSCYKNILQAYKKVRFMYHCLFQFTEDVVTVGVWQMELNTKIHVHNFGRVSFLVKREKRKCRGCSEKETIF